MFSIGIGYSRNQSPDVAAREAVAAARVTVGSPRLALAFGSSRVDQDSVHAALCSEIDPAVLTGGSSFAEVAGAAVSTGGVAVLLVDSDDAYRTLIDLITREGIVAGPSSGMTVYGLKVLEERGEKGLWVAIVADEFFRYTSEVAERLRDLL